MPSAGDRRIGATVRAAGAVAHSDRTPPVPGQPEPVRLATEADGRSFPVDAVTSGSLGVVLARWVARESRSRRPTLGHRDRLTSTIAKL